MVKNQPPNVGDVRDVSLIPGLGRSLIRDWLQNPPFRVNSPWATRSRHMLPDEWWTSSAMTVRPPSSAFSTLKNAWAGQVTQRPVPRRQHTLKQERESRTLSYQNGSRVVKQNDFGIGLTWVAILAPQVLVAQLCPTLCDPMDCSLPGSSVHGILQVRILEWVAMPFSRRSYQPRDRTQVSHIVGRYFTIWTTWEAKVKVAQLCLTLCDLMDYLDPGIKPRSPELQADSLLVELPA